jgi:hypothetical protein
VDRIHLSQDRDRWQAVVKMVTTLLFLDQLRNLELMKKTAR